MEDGEKLNQSVVQTFPLYLHSGDTNGIFTDIKGVENKGDGMENPFTKMPAVPLEV